MSKSSDFNQVVESIHAKQVEKLVKKLGNKPLSDLALKKEAHLLKLPQFLGVRMQNESMPDGNGCYIINNDLLNGHGIHWIGVVQQNKVCYVYDSFGRRCDKLVKYFHHNRISQGYKIRNTDNDADQRGNYTVTCGHRVLSALKIYKDHGLDYYMQI